MADLTKFSHGDTLPNGRMCWVGMDGMAREVTPGMFYTLTETIKLNHVVMDGINERLEGDVGGFQTVISMMVEALRFRNELLSGEELEKIYASANQEIRANEIGKAYARIEGEYGL